MRALLGTDIAAAPRWYHHGTASQLLSPISGGTRDTIQNPDMLCEHGGKT